MILKEQATINDLYREPGKAELVNGEIVPDPKMKFFVGGAVFAVEVRSEGDDGLAAERAMAQELADYFAAARL